MFVRLHGHGGTSLDFEFPSGWLCENVHDRFILFFSFSFSFLFRAPSLFFPSLLVSIGHFYCLDIDTPCHVNRVRRPVSMFISYEMNFDQ